MSASFVRMQVVVLFCFLILIMDFVILPVYVLPVYVYVFCCIICQFMHNCLKRLLIYILLQLLIGSYCTSCYYALLSPLGPTPLVIVGQFGLSSAPHERLSMH